MEEAEENLYSTYLPFSSVLDIRKVGGIKERGKGSGRGNGLERECVIQIEGRCQRERVSGLWGGRVGVPIPATIVPVCLARGYPGSLTFITPFKTFPTYSHPPFAPRLMIFICLAFVGLERIFICLCWTSFKGLLF